MMLKSGTISLFVVLLIALPDHTLAQTRIIQGTVLRNYKQTKRPFNSIPVTLYNQAKNSRSNPSLTDAKGNYYFYNVPEGTYQLEIWIYGTVDGSNRNDKARVHKVVINYQRAVTNGKRRLLKINPILVTI